jgi:hypothetical protein
VRSTGDLYFLLLVVISEPSCQTCHPGNNSRRDPDLGRTSRRGFVFGFRHSVHASCAELQQMSGMGFAFSAGGAVAALEMVDEATLRAGVEAQTQMLMEGQAWQNVLQIYQRIEDEKKAEVTNLRYCCPVEVERQLERKELVRKTTVKVSTGEFDSDNEYEDSDADGESDSSWRSGSKTERRAKRIKDNEDENGESGSDIEDEDGGEESRCSTPEKGKIVYNDEDLTTPPGPCRGRNNFFGVFFGSADATTVPKAFTIRANSESPSSSVDEEPSPDQGRPICLCSPKTPEEEMAPSTDLLDLFDGCSQSKSAVRGDEEVSTIKQKLALIPDGACTAADFFLAKHEVREARSPESKGCRTTAMPDAMVQNFNSGQTTALICWFDTQQLTIDRTEFAAQISGMNGGRSCNRKNVKDWCHRLRASFPKLMAPKSEQDNRKRERAAGQSGLRARLAVLYQARRGQAELSRQGEHEKKRKAPERNPERKARKKKGMYKFPDGNTIAWDMVHKRKRYERKSKTPLYPARRRARERLCISRLSCPSGSDVLNGHRA